MKLDLNQPWSKLLLAAVVVIAPATLSYCKAHEEAHAESTRDRREADAGYHALVSNVEQLQRIVAAQQLTIQLLTERYVSAPDAGVDSAEGPDAAPHVELPGAAGVQFAPLPEDNAQALRQTAPPETM